MILYSVHYHGPNSNYEWSIVTIHKTREDAENAMDKYKQNCKDIGIENTVKYCIIEIDTESSDDCIYDYTNVDDIIYTLEEPEFY